MSLRYIPGEIISEILSYIPGNILYEWSIEIPRMNLYIALAMKLRGIKFCIKTKKDYKEYDNGFRLFRTFDGHLFVIDTCPFQQEYILPGREKNIIHFFDNLGPNVRVTNEYIPERYRIEDETIVVSNYKNYDDSFVSYELPRVFGGDDIYLKNGVLMIFDEVYTFMEVEELYQN